MSKILNKVKYYAAGGEYGEKMNSRVSDRSRQLMSSFKSMPLKRKIMTTGGYMLRKAKSLMKGE